jgi:hypothetical protein
MPAFGQADNFTVIALPDTQYYTCTGGGSCAAGLGIFADQTSWIAANRDALDIRFVTQLGDCTENGNVTSEFDIADAAFQTIEAATGPGYPDGIPFGVAVGNHDQSPIGNPGSIPTVNDVNNPSQGTTTTTYNDYFGADRFCPASSCRSYFLGNFGINHDNTYQFFSANGYDFIILHIEYMPSDTALRQAVIGWADDVLTTYSARRAIVVSHHVLDAGASPNFSNQGSALYEGLKHHPNLFLILGGHVTNESRRSDTFAGNTVHTLLSDYQGRTNGGDGWLRILEFQPANNLISVKTYSPTLDQFETDANSQFTLSYDMGSGYPSTPNQVTFQQGANGYAGAVDTYLEVSTGAHGTEQSFFWDGDPLKYALVRFGALFDTEGGPIPQGATITSAILHYVTDDNGNDANVHQVTIPWTDTVDYAGFGTNPGAQADEDYDSALVGQASGAAPGDTRTEHTLDVTASVAAWSADPSTNRGWIFVPTGNSGAGTRTAEYTPDPSDRPMLVVSYLANECTLDTDCNDSELCTTDTCVDGLCQNNGIAGCCEADVDCADANTCTQDSCNLTSNQCENVASPGCCVTNTDCNDADQCTLDACVQANLSALTLDGNGDWVTFGAASTHTELGLPQFTVETWFRRTGTGATSSTGTGGVVAVPLVTKGRGEADGNNRDANYFLGISDAAGGKLAADFEHNGPSPNNHPVTGATTVTQNVWHHAAATFDGSNFRIYLDGVLDGTTPTTTVPRSDSIQPFAIGTAMNSTSVAEGAFLGQLDEVRVWARALSASEIAANMHVPISSNVDLRGRWGLDQVIGTAATDSTANVNHGTLVGNAGWVTTNLVSMGNGSCQATVDPTCCYENEDCNDGALCTDDACHLVPAAGTLDFDGTNDYATKGEPSTLGSYQFTVEGWIKWDGGGATASSGSGGVTGVPIIAKGFGEGDNPSGGTNIDANYFLAIATGTGNVLAADFESSTDSSNHPVFGVTPITTGVWHHVAATYNGSEWRLYLDGNLDATNTAGATPRGDSIQHFGIGAAMNSTGVATGAFNGRIHDVRVWDHARSRAQIQTAMNQTITDGAGLLGSFPLAEGSGTVANDETGNGNTATIVGATWTTETNECVSGPNLCESTTFAQGTGGYAGTVDTYIEVSTGAHGGEDHLFWDGDPQKFTLIRFDDLFVSEGGPIPDNQQIGSAQLTYVLDDNGNNGNVHEVLVDWDANVDYAGFGPAAGAQAGVDYTASPLAQQAPGTLVGTETTYTIDVTSSVTAWQADPASNKGWIIVPTGTSGVGIRSAEHANSAHRPRLTIHCLPEPSATLLFACGALALAGLARNRRRA